MERSKDLVLKVLGGSKFVLRVHLLIKVQLVSSEFVEIGMLLDCTEIQLLSNSLFLCQSVGFNYLKRQNNLHHIYLDGTSGS